MADVFSGAGSFLSSSGGLGLIGSIGSGIGSYLSASAAGTNAESQYQAEASKALIESSALSNNYKIGAINMLLNAKSQAAEYQSQAYGYDVEALQKKGQATEYDMSSAISLLNQANTLRTAKIVGASALDAVRQGAEEEEQLREQGRLFRGQQRTSLAAGGTDVGSGNALDILRQTDEGVEADSAAIRYKAQKNRYTLLLQQKNMWMQAAIQGLESENYKTAANNLRASADVSSQAASSMRTMGELALQSGQEGQTMYNKLADLALEGGQATADAYNNMGGIMSSASKAAGVAGLLGAVMPTVTGLLVDKKNNDNVGDGTFGFNSFGYQKIRDEASWNFFTPSDNANDGTSDWYKTNSFKLGQFMPKVKTYGVQ